MKTASLRRRVASANGWSSWAPPRWECAITLRCNECSSDFGATRSPAPPPSRPSTRCSQAHDPRRRFRQLHGWLPRGAAGADCRLEKHLILKQKRISLTLPSCLADAFRPGFLAVGHSRLVKRPDLVGSHGNRRFRAARNPRLDLFHKRTTPHPQAFHPTRVPLQLAAISRIDQQVPVIGDDAVIQQPSLGLARLLAEHGPIGVAIPCTLQQERSGMTARCQMENSRIHRSG